ncbi:MAG: type II secretion system protein GspM [Syntrophales bacterium]|jgi:hypothetical protein|nr:type II secretion system protein GspM [Syntrophales bacterium]
MISLSFTRERKYILIGGAILLFFGLVYTGFPLFHGIADRGAQIAIKEKQLEKYRQFIEEGKGLKRRLSALTSSLRQGESGLLRGKTPALAAVDMQNILNVITQKSGVEITSVRVLKTTKQEGTKYLSVPVRFSIGLTTRQLKEILYGIETSDRYLTVREMDIYAPERKSREQLRVDMTVDGFMIESES